MSTLVFAIDPGTTDSAYVLWDGDRIHDHGEVPNGEMLVKISESRAEGTRNFAIEQIASYGMAVGAETFETVWWAGRFAQRIEDGGGKVAMVKRIPIKVHHCRTAKANDANIRQALVDRFGAPGTKKTPGRTFGIKSHRWAAFALATCWYDQNISGLECAP